MLTETGSAVVVVVVGSESRGNGERNVFSRWMTRIRGVWDGTGGKRGTTIDKEKEKKAAVSKKSEDRRTERRWVSSTIAR